MLIVQHIVERVRQEDRTEPPAILFIQYFAGTSTQLQPCMVYSIASRAQYLRAQEQV